jgi:hypothetical protein
MDVEFSIELIRGKNIGSPRAEDASFLMASGIAGSLDKAFRTATTGTRAMAGGGLQTVAQ